MRYFESKKSVLLKGSGINIYDYKNLKETIGETVVCLAARLLRDKGIYEFVSAARILKERGAQAKFCLAGDLDMNNPTGLNLDELDKLKEEFIEFLDFKKIYLIYFLNHI